MNPLIQKNANGYAWKKASLIEKSEFCTIQSQAFSKTDNHAQTFLVELDALFQGDDDSTMRIELSQAIGLILAGAPALLDKPIQPSEPPNDK